MGVSCLRHWICDSQRHPLRFMRQDARRSRVWNIICSHSHVRASVNFWDGRIEAFHLASDYPATLEARRALNQVPSILTRKNSPRDRTCRMALAKTSRLHEPALSCAPRRPPRSLVTSEMLSWILWQHALLRQGKGRKASYGLDMYGTDIH